MLVIAAASIGVNGCGPSHKAQPPAAHTGIEHIDLKVFGTQIRATYNRVSRVQVIGTADTNNGDNEVIYSILYTSMPIGGYEWSETTCVRLTGGGFYCSVIPTQGGNLFERLGYGQFYVGTVPADY